MQKVLGCLIVARYRKEDPLGRSSTIFNMETIFHLIWNKDELFSWSHKQDKNDTIMLRPLVSSAWAKWVHQCGVFGPSIHGFNTIWNPKRSQNNEDIWNCQLELLYTWRKTASVMYSWQNILLLKLVDSSPLYTWECQLFTGLSILCVASWWIPYIPPTFTGAGHQWNGSHQQGPLLELVWPLRATGCNQCLHSPFIDCPHW